jgi:large subunit ribosomal protein L4e
MCRKARMFAPHKIWRRWHRKVNVTQRRHAVAAALAASAVTPLVMARGHLVKNVTEFPIVINNFGDGTTKALLSTLSSFGVADDLAKVRKSRHARAGQGKLRNARYVLRKGPLVIHDEADGNLKRAARNLPGVDTCNVHRLNILQLAPGGHLGRFVIFTQDAFEELDTVFGTYDKKSTEKAGYTLPRTQMACADLARIINSDQVQAKLRDIRHSVRAHDKTRKNPLTNKALMNKLNPYAKTQAAAFEKLKEERHKKKKDLKIKERHHYQKKVRTQRKQKRKALQTHTSFSAPASMSSLHIGFSHVTSPVFLVT